MYWATKQGNLPAVRALLKSGVDANVDMNLQKWLPSFAQWLPKEATRLL